MRWGVAVIAEVCEPTEQRDPRQNPAGEFHYVDIAGIDRTLKAIVEHQTLMGIDAPSRARKIIRKDDVLVSTVRPNLNAVAMVPACLDSQIASTGFCVLRPNRDCVEPRYLFYWAITSTFVDALTSRVRGANYPAVSDRDVKEVTIPLPPLSEQRRIVDLLDQADSLRRLRGEADAKASHILSALFIRMFGDPATNPMKWPRVRFDHLLSDIDSGWSPICEERHASPSEWGVLKLGAITSNQYLESENKALPSDLEPRPEVEIRPGDLLFSRKNTYALVGACAYVEETRSKLLLSDLIFRLNLKPDSGIHPVYLWGLLTCPSKRPSIEMLASGSAGSMPNISKKRLGSLHIEKPSYNMQMRYAEIVNQFKCLMKFSILSQSKIERIFNVLLHRTFTGRLTDLVQ